VKFADLPAEQQQKLLAKLAKLKALSECPTGNVNETATAAAAMTRLMLEYQVEVAELGLETERTGVEELEVFEEAQSRGLPMWQHHLIHGLAKAHHCGCLTSSRVVGFYVESFRRATEKRYHLVGERQDVEQVQRLFFYCLNEIERLCYQWMRRAPVTAKNDFRLGASRGIVDKVNAELQAVLSEQEVAHHSLALALFESKLQAVEDYFQKRGVSYSTRSYRAPSDAAYKAGYHAGSNLDLKGRSRPALGPGQK